MSFLTLNSFLTKSKEYLGLTHNNSVQASGNPANNNFFTSNDNDIQDFIASPDGSRMDRTKRQHSADSLIQSSQSNADGTGRPLPPVVKRQKSDSPSMKGEAKATQKIYEIPAFDENLKGSPRQTVASSQNESKIKMSSIAVIKVEIKQRENRPQSTDRLNNQFQSKRSSRNAGPGLGFAGNEIPGLELQIKNLTSQLMACKHRYRHFKEESKTLRKELADSQRNLSECKNVVFRLQPLSQISDSEIIKDLDLINQNVIKWIDDRLGQIEAEYHGITDVEIFQTGFDESAAMFMREYPDGGHNYARYLIHQQLFDFIFTNDFAIFGLSDSEVDLWKGVEASMRELKPTRDPKTIHLWKSETYLALSKMGHLEKNRDDKMNQAMGKIVPPLRAAFPWFFQGTKNLQTLFSNIVAPTGNLALKMKTSTSTYRLHMRRPNLGILHIRTKKLHLGQYGLVDIDTGKTLRKESPITFGKDEVFGYGLVQLEPGLSRTKDDSSDLRLRQEVFLVKLCHPLRKNKS